MPGDSGHLKVMRLLPFAAAVEDPPRASIRLRRGDSRPSSLHGARRVLSGPGRRVVPGRRPWLLPVIRDLTRRLVVTMREQRSDTSQRGGTGDILT